MLNSRGHVGVEMPRQSVSAASQYGVGWQRLALIVIGFGWGLLADSRLMAAQPAQIVLAVPASAVAGRDEFWVRLRDGQTLMPSPTQITSLDIHGLVLADESISWNKIHSVYLPEPWQEQAEGWIRDLGLPWALADYRLQLRDWNAAYRSAQQLEVKLSAEPAPEVVANHPAWDTVDQCARSYHLHRGNWEQALVELLQQRVRRQQRQERGTPSPSSNQQEPAAEDPVLATALKEMPPLLLSPEHAKRQLTRTRRLATELIALGDARGCWYAGLLAEAGGDGALSEQCRAAAQRNWPPQQQAELEVWQAIWNAENLRRSGQPVEAGQQLQVRLAETRDPSQLVVMRVKRAEALTQAARNEDWRRVVLAWLEVTALHERDFPPLAAIALDRAEQHTRQFGSPVEADLLRQKREQLFSDW